MPLIHQEVASCPIQCVARSALHPNTTPAYVLQFNAETGKTTFSSSDQALVGKSDQFVLTCTSILSILSQDMRTISDQVTITFT